MTAGKSLSPISGQIYNVPAQATDSDLKRFTSRFNNRDIVAVQGLGFVGTAMCLVVANSRQCSQYAVLGIDTATEANYWKIADINNGVCPIKAADPNIDAYFNSCRRERNFYATFDPEAYQAASVIIVDINLDVLRAKDTSGKFTDYSVPMADFESAIRTIGENCNEDALVLIETTVPPGTCSRVVRPILSKELKKRGLGDQKIKIGHSYERVMPGPHYIDSIQNFYRVYSGVDEKSAAATENFLRSIISTDTYPLTRLENTESSEMAKVLENSYRAMNISFMVEWSRFAEQAGVNLYSVVDAIRLRPTHANLMYPGIGVGGYCLTKDPLMASWSSTELFGLTAGLSSSVRAVEINDLMPQQAFDFTKKSLAGAMQNRLFGLLGVAYGPGIGDTRSSPVETYARLLTEQGAELAFCDPYVKYWHEMDAEVFTKMPELFEKRPSTIVITTRHVDFVEDYALYEQLNHSDYTPTVIDLVGLLKTEQLDSRYKLGDNLFVLGVGG